MKGQVSSNDGGPATRERRPVTTVRDADQMIQMIQMIQITPEQNIVLCVTDQCLRLPSTVSRMDTVSWSLSQSLHRVLSVCESVYDRNHEDGLNVSDSVAWG